MNKVTADIIERELTRRRDVLVSIEARIAAAQAELDEAIAERDQVASEMAKLDEDVKKDKP